MGGEAPKTAVKGVGEMEDQHVRGEELEKEAEKKLSGWGWGFLTVTNKYDDAADLFDKAATCYKLAKSWDKAGAAYVKLANCYLKVGSKLEVALAYVDAAKCYKKISSQEAILCLDKAVGFFLENGRLVMAASLCKEIGELYEQEENFEQAIVFQERAADLFQSEEITIFANQSKQKVTQFAAQLEQYSKAREIFEEIAMHSINNSLLKYSVKEILLNAGLCQLCSGDFVAMKNTLLKYRDLDPTFSHTQEFKFLYRLAFAIDQEDVTKFTRIVKKFSIMTKLDPWKTTLLLRAEHTLKEKILEDDLT